MLDSNVKQIQEFCKQHALSEKEQEKIIWLSKKVLPLTNKNWNISYNKNFSIWFELIVGERYLDFSYEPHLDKFVWFKQEHANCVYGFNMSDNVIEGLIKWID